MLWKIVEAPKLMCHNMKKLTKNQMLWFYTIYRLKSKLLHNLMQNQS